MSFPKYPKYKDSGVEWLGEVPEHWKVIAIKWLSPVKRGASPRPIDDPQYFDDEGEFAWVRIADVSACDGVLKETYQRLSELGSSLSVKMAPGELFVSIAGTVGKPCLSAIKACIHDGFVYFPTLKINPKFLYRIFEGSTCYGGLGKWGTQLNLNTDTIGSIRVALAPDAELEPLLAFLDRETSKIDGLVGEQRRLIELLKEKRQAVISHAVTKGLNPNAPLKPSGIEWLGDVPEHWAIKRFQRCVYVAEGQVDPEDVTYSEMALIAPNHIESATGRLLGLESANEQGAESGKFLCRAGDVVYSKIRPALRKVCIAPVDCLCSADMYPLRSHSGLTNPFLFWLMLSEQFSALAVLESQRVAMPKINRESLKAVMFAVPPTTEQSAIADFLICETKQFDALTAEAEHGIELLQERRTALISAAVTGKIDVRNLLPKQK